jgi:hypothetical protein
MDETSCGIIKLLAARDFQRNCLENELLGFILDNTPQL